MKNQKELQELFKRVHMYLDGELKKEEEAKLLREIQSDPGYMAILSKERSFREFIKSKLQRRKVSPALIQNIKDTINIPH